MNSYLETPNELAKKLADMVMVEFSGPVSDDEYHPGTCDCSACWVQGIEKRIRQSVENEEQKKGPKCFSDWWESYGQFLGCCEREVALIVWTEAQKGCLTTASSGTQKAASADAER